MKSDRLPETGESLQLLVDPMCNLFAGLVLLSVFLALFAGQNSVGPAPEKSPAARFANAELLQKRLMETREETARVQSQNQRWTAQLRGFPDLPALGAVEKALAEADACQGGGGDISAENMRLALESEQTRLKQEEAALLNEKESLAKESVRLQERGQSLSRLQPGPAETAGEVRVRLPRARPSDKMPLYLLISGGRVYPVQSPSGAEDDTHVQRLRTPSEDRIFPKSGEGFPVDRATEKFLEQVDTQRCYPVLVVYADSFVQYRAVRRMLEEKGMAFGWEPRETGAELRLSARGYKPEAQ